ncbi:AAA family ATPase [Paenibacillus silvae]|uniref:AAA family ATPase n=1 Tax=Paenibacillus silvae TaxID=1325358 RepID=UPI0011A6FEFB|nr:MULTISPECIES: AAA family ATPase [Paenibacillus]MCK6076962.1 AAA family ATPase [Paenibacillus silvae]MCK6152722.1 AAA family ATPase [Paenibacillus silvae]MCK6269531.1 AAA family ATPase [Paenibacillus silvae]
MSKQPLFVITGASGTGKTTVSSHVRKLLPEFDVFDMDIIDNVDWQIAKENWLRVAYSISLSGRGTVLCGTMVPENIASSSYIDRFDRILYINLHCDDTTRQARLAARGWNEEMIQDHRNFANWLLQNADTAFDPAMPTVDTTGLSSEEAAKQIEQWVRANG